MDREELIETIGTALYESDGITWNDKAEAALDAALKVMMEPDEAMLEKGADAVADESGWAFDSQADAEGIAAGALQAMLSTLTQEGDEI